MKFGSLSLVVGLVSLSGLSQSGQAQVNQGVTTPAAQYFASRNASGQNFGTTVPQTTGNFVPAPQPVQLSGNKPFRHIQHPPTLSPYLGLDAFPETGTSLPNYHMFVQPQFRQREANEAQARELRRLQQQLRVATARGVVSKNPTGGMPTTGGSSQFMNVGNYYPGLR